MRLHKRLVPNNGYIYRSLKIYASRCKASVKDWAQKLEKVHTGIIDDILYVRKKMVAEIKLFIEEAVIEHFVERGIGIWLGGGNWAGSFFALPTSTE